MHALLSCLLAGVLGVPAHAMPREDAARHFEAGVREARAGHFQVAIEQFLEAHATFPHPAALHNIAHAYIGLGDWESAYVYYLQYRDLSLRVNGVVSPDIPDLARLAEQRGALRPDGSLQPPAAPQAPAPREGPEPSEVPPVSEVVPVEAVPPDPGQFVDAAYDQVVVTASRIGQDPLDSPATMSVLTAEDIRLSGIVDVPELLRRVAGVEVTWTTAGQPDVAIRGFQRPSNNRVLVLIDGRTTSADFTGTTNWATLPITVEQIARIEVIRGTGSAIYGADAVTGVINIITRSPDGGGFVASVSSGFPQLGRAAAVASGRIGGGDFEVAASYHRQARWARGTRPDPDEADVPIDWLVDPEVATESLRIDMRADHRLGSRGLVSVSGGIASGPSGFRPFGEKPEYGILNEHRYVRGDLSAGPVHFRAFWNSDHGTIGPLEQYTGERDGTARFDNQVVDAVVELPLAFRTGPVEHRLNMGGGWRYEGIKFGYLERGFEGRHHEHHIKAFVHEQMTLGPVSAVGSLRVDRFQDPQEFRSPTISPRGALLYRIFDETSLRFTAGRAFRAPTALEFYMDFAVPVGNDGLYAEFLGDETLDPEEITTIELGIHDSSTLFHELDLVVHVNRLSGVIGTPSGPPAHVAFDASANGFRVIDGLWSNASDVYEGMGAEADLELFPGDGLDLFANVAVSRLRRLGEEDAEPSEISTVPVVANLGGSVRSPFRTDVSVWANWTSDRAWTVRERSPGGVVTVQERSLSSRLRVSARLAVRPLAREDFEVSVNAWDIPALIGGDRRDHPNGSLVGGRVYGTASWRF
ncbi:MAG: TonB-dependent receptor [Myxococcales bacterium]|nr:TonB-dependent receptor [Myxococcales bacterium]